MVEAAKLLEPIGYEFEGINGNKHLIWRHRESGAIYRMSQSGWKNGGAQKGAVAQAQRNIRHAQSVSQRWVAWLVEEFDIFDTEERQVTFSPQRLAEKFLAENPDIRGVSKTLWVTALKQHPQATLVASGTRGVSGSSSVWKLRGPLYGVTAAMPEEEVANVVTEEEPDGVVAAGAASRVGSGELPVESVVSAGVEEGADPEPPVTEADDDGAAAAPRGAAADTNVLRVEELTGSGVVIPAALAAQLADAFGVGDVQAENDLMRAAATEAAILLERAAELLAAAATLSNATVVEKPATVVEKPHPKSGLGPKNVRRLRLLKAHRDELPSPFLTHDVVEFLTRHDSPITQSAAGSLVWILEQNGILRRIKNGVYEWA